jgi:site-specific DNA recombinase
MKPAIAYAAKSTLDAKGSIATQLEDCRRMAEREGWRVVAEYTDEAASAFSGDRGPGLAAAMADAERTGGAIIVVQHSDRLARGDGVQARHLGEIYFWSAKAGVSIRSVQDDSTFTNPLLAFAMGERAHEDSRRKGLAVKAGMERRARRGLTSGQRIYGYRLRENGEGLDIDPFEAGIVRRVFREFIAGRGVTHIARSLNEDGVRTSKGKIWRQSTVGQMLANPIYVGMIRFHDELIRGQHEPILDRRTWEAAEALRFARPAQGRGRMPKGNHLFRKGLLRCECGHALSPRTNYRGHQVYVCVGKQINGREFCDMPHVWRDRIDTAVFNYFMQLGLDLDATREAVLAASEHKLGEINLLLESAEREAQRATERLARVRRDYTDRKLDAEDWQSFKAELVPERDAAEAQAERLRRSRAAVAASAGRVDHEHEVLRHLAAIRRSIVGDIQAAEGVEAVRAALMRLFEAFVVHRSTPSQVHVELVGEYWIEPIVRGDMLGESGPSGMPRTTRLPLDVASVTNNVAAGAGGPFAPCAPRPRAAGARATASGSRTAASASAPSSRARAAIRTSRPAPRPSTSRSAERRQVRVAPARRDADRPAPAHDSAASGDAASWQRVRMSATMSCSRRVMRAICSAETPLACAARTCCSSVAIASRTAFRPPAS